MQYQHKESPTLLTVIDDLRIESVLDMGFFNEPAAFEMVSQTHCHPWWELIVHIDGAFSVEFLNREQLMMTEGTLCLIPPNIYHSTQKHSPTPHKLGMRFCCTQESVTGQSRICDICTNILSASRQPVLLEHCESLCQLIRQIHAEITMPGFATQVCVRAMLTQFYIQFFRLLSGEDSGKKDCETPVHPPTLQEMRWPVIEEFFFYHCAEPVTEADLAQELHLSKRQLNRVLKQTYAMSFRELLIETRLNRAAQLLCETDKSIEDVVFLVGYTSLSGFYSAFQRKFGMSPGRYAHRFRNPYSANKTRRDK